jgi:hypothetical protein
LAVSGNIPTTAHAQLPVRPSELPTGRSGPEYRANRLVTACNIGGRRAQVAVARIAPERRLLFGPEIEPVRRLVWIALLPPVHAKASPRRYPRGHRSHTARDLRLDKLSGRHLPLGSQLTTASAGCMPARVPPGAQTGQPGRGVAVWVGHGSPPLHLIEPVARLPRYPPLAIGLPPEPEIARRSRSTSSGCNLR